jgi:hypothetical protein
MLKMAAKWILIIFTNIWVISFLIDKLFLEGEPAYDISYVMLFVLNFIFCMQFVIDIANLQFEKESDEKI